jgi:hypothetical protein
MLSETFSVIRKNWTMYAVVVGCLVGLGVLDDFSGRRSSGGATFFVWSYVAMCVQGAIIYSTTFNDVGKRMGFGKTLPYFLKTIALILSAVIVCLPVFVLFPLTPGDDLLPISLLAFICIVFVAYALLMALLGTWPASGIAGIGTSFASAFRRGVSQFLPTFGRLIAAIFLPLLLTLLLVIGASELEKSPSLISGNSAYALTLLVSAVAAFAQAVSVSYSAIVLAHVYLAGQPNAGRSATMPA